jgi:hypothetical protein
MLLVGQLLLTQVGLSVFLLSRRLTGSGIAALSSAIIIWFLSPTPLYFVTWGRYPLVMGAALLPIALLCAIDLIEEPRFNCRAFFCAAITFGGLAFAHIRLSAFYALFVVIYLVARWIRARAAMRWREISRVALVGAAGILFGAIWFAALAARGASWEMILAQNAAAPEIDLDTAIAVTLTHHGPMVWLIAFVGAIVGIVRRTRVVLVTLTWYAGLLAISVLLPGGEELLPLSLIVLMGFLPAALAIGDLAHWAEMKTATTHGAIEIAATTTQSRPSSAENPDRAGDLGVFVGAREASNCREQLQKATARDFAAVAWIAILLIVVLTGTRDRVSFVNPATILFSSADAAAMEWIKTRTPTDAHFLINSTVWFDTNYVPSDGGGWIPYTTGRAVDYLNVASAPIAADTDAFAQWLAARKIEYVYLGRRTGILSKSDFAAQPARYVRVYDHSGIAIFMVTR